MANVAARPPEPPARWIDAEPGMFREHFNRRTFALRHGFASHPQFQLPQLVELAERTLATRPDDLRYDVGNVEVGQRWETVGPRPFSAMEALARIEHAGAWLVLFRVEQDRLYGPILDAGLADLKAQIGGDLDGEIMKKEIIIFVTSPKRVTPYHVDRECNFLLQVRGTKTVHVFDREDREVLAEHELERYWTVGDKQPGYRAHLQGRATSFRFAPGNGCHIPVNCPHWVENDDNVSISISVNFQFKDRVRANVYRANYLLRRLGLRPTPPGRSRVLDGVKAFASPPATWAATRVMQLRHARAAGGAA